MFLYELQTVHMYFKIENKIRTAKEILLWAIDWLKSFSILLAAVLNFQLETSWYLQLKYQFLYLVKLLKVVSDRLLHFLFLHMPWTWLAPYLYSIAITGCTLRRFNLAVFFKTAYDFELIFRSLFLL